MSQNSLRGKTPFIGQMCLNVFSGNYFIREKNIIYLTTRWSERNYRYRKTFWSKIIQKTQPKIQIISFPVFGRKNVFVQNLDFYFILGFQMTFLRVVQTGKFRVVF